MPKSRNQGYAALPPARRIHSKNRVNSEDFSSTEFIVVFFASVGFLRRYSNFSTVVRRTAQSLMFPFVNSADIFLERRKMLWNLSIAFLLKKPYTAISKREPPLKVSFFLNLLHLGQHRFQTEAVLSFSHGRSVCLEQPLVLQGAAPTEANDLRECLLSPLPAEIFSLLIN